MDNRVNQDLEEHEAESTEIYAVMSSEDLNMELSDLNDLSRDQLKGLFIKGNNS